MSRPDFNPDANEPAVRSEGLRVLVDAARAEPTPPVGVDAAALHDAWATRRSSRRRAVVGLGIAAGLAGLAIAAAVPDGAPRSTPSTEVAAAPLEPPADDGEARRAARPAPTPRATAIEPSPDDAPVDVVRLARNMTVVATEAASQAQPEVLQPDRVRLPQGHWEVRNPTEAPLHVVLPDGEVEVAVAVIHVEVAGQTATVTVQEGEVHRHAADGRVTTLGVTEPSTAPPTSSAVDLAAHAETQLVAGQHARAIATFRKLIGAHPRSPEARVGLIDLARLLEARGRADEARCAYALFEKRWPGHALGGDVARAREALGPGPKCRGLRPR